MPLSTLTNCGPTLTSLEMKLFRKPLSCAWIHRQKRHGSDLKSAVEAGEQEPGRSFCLCKETATEQLEGKKQRYHDQRLLLKRVEQGLRRLPGDYERILRWKAGFEHHRLTWNQIGNRLNEDSSYCRRRYDEGIDILTGIVYGAAAFPIQGVLDMDTSLEQEKILATDFDKNRQE